MNRFQGGAPLLAVWFFVASCATAPKPETTLAVTSATGERVSVDSATAAFDVDGIKVILRSNTASEVVAVRLFLRGGTRQLTLATQGIESLWLHTAEFGTAMYPGDRSRTAWARTGSEETTETGADWTVSGFVTIREQVDSAWNVWADRLRHPALARKYVEITRERLASLDRRRRSSADGMLSLAADSVAFDGHPYALRPGGTETSLRLLDSAAVAQYASATLVKSRLLLVIVGNISREEVSRAVARSFATLPVGDYRWTLPALLTPTAGPPAMIMQPSSTDYLLGYFGGPSIDDVEFPSFRMAVAILSGRMSHVIREEQGLSYAAMAPLIDRGATAGGVYVSTRQPSKVLKLIRGQIDTLKSLTFDLANVHYMAEQFIMDFFGENSTSDAQADFLARSALYLGDYRKAGQMMDGLRQVTPGRIQHAARRYFKNIRFAFVGDTTHVRRAELTGS